MGTTTAGGIPYPVNTDTPDVPRDIKALADWLQANSPRVAASAAVLPAGMAVGTKCWQTDIARVVVWNGSAWELERGYYAKQAGQASIAAAACAASASLSVAVTFAASRFTQTPRVQAVMAQVLGNTVPFILRTGVQSSTGVTFYMFNSSAGSLTPGAAMPVDWEATQMTAASGSG